jgi:glycosyltransferase involved in cell wall biosynthesis
MRIVLYTTIYNEARILPFFIAHYRRFVSKFVFYDNASSDDGVEIIRRAGIEHEIVGFDTREQLDELTLTHLRNNVWKQSKGGGVDYVIVCDADEFLHHRELERFLRAKKRQGITIFKPEGYNMFSADFPSLDKGLLVDQVSAGVRADREFSGAFGLERFDKCILFSPDDLDEIGFDTGSHYCNPKGNVRLCEHEGLKLLHYKALSVSYLLEKMAAAKRRVTQAQKDMGLSYHYFNDARDVERDFWEYLRRAADVTR